MTSDPHIPAPGYEVVGKYVLAERLGEGGMGEVWGAHHAQLGRDVAIKFMFADHVESAELRDRFEREARAAALLRTQHVVDVLDYGVDERCGRPYIVMERLEGEDLRSRLKARGQLTPDEVLEIARQITRALGEAHAADIVHRDLTPANVFLAQIDGAEVVKLLDFGLARVSDDTKAHTRTGVVMGSVHFMAPEQARSTRRADARADLWSFGVLLYRCLVGVNPFDGETNADVLVKVCTENATPPSQLAALPGALDRFFDKALQRDPKRRFQTAEALCRAFADALSGTATLSAASLTPTSSASLAPAGTPRLTAAMSDGVELPDPTVELAPDPGSSPSGSAAAWDTTETDLPTDPRVDIGPTAVSEPRVKGRREGARTWLYAAVVLLLAGLGGLALAMGGPAAVTSASRPDDAAAADTDGAEDVARKPVPSDVGATVDRGSRDVVATSAASTSAPDRADDAATIDLDAVATAASATPPPASRPAKVAPTPPPPPPPTGVADDSLPEKPTWGF